MVVSAAPQLRGYQTDAVGRVRAEAMKDPPEKHRRIILQAATGSGKTVMACELVRRAVTKDRRVVFLAHRRRLIQQASERLESFGIPHGVIMAGSATGSGLVQVCSRDTLASRAIRHDWNKLPPAQLVIVDEAHNAKAALYQKILAQYPTAHIIGLTATPAFPDGSGLGRYFDALIEAEKTSRLVEQGYLVPVRCFAPQRQGYRKGAARLAGDPVSHWKRLADGRPTVLFTSRVAASVKIADEFNAGGVPAAHIDGHTPDDERQRVYDKLSAGELMVVCNCGVWTEGTDLPALSCCILFRMVGSCVLYLQAVGRIMRPAPGKKDGILIDHSGCVYRHGYPDEDFPWSLDGSTVDCRVGALKKDKKRKAVIACPSCGRLITGQVCPECGARLALRRLPTAVRHEHLVETRSRLSPADRAARAVADWRTCLFRAAAIGLTVGAAARMFNSVHGELPWNMRDVLPDVPPPGMLWARKVAEVFPHYNRRGRHA